MSKNITSASIVAGLLVLWLASGLWDDQTAAPELALAAESEASEQASQNTQNRVRVELKQAEPRAQSVLLRGRTEAKRNVEVTAEISGQIVNRSVERGEQVRQGRFSAIARRH